MGLSRQWLRAGRDDQMFQQSLKRDSNCFFWQGGRETWTLKWLMDAQFGQAFIPFRQIWGRPCHRWMWSPTQESRQTSDSHGTPIGFSPLINCHIANWKITVFNRWIYYKWAVVETTHLYIGPTSGRWGPQWRCAVWLPVTTNEFPYNLMLLKQ